MKTGIFVACAGRQDGGPETYERCLVENIAHIDQHNEYHIYCFSQQAIDSFKVQQDNMIFHRLWPKSRWVSLPVSLPLCLRKDRIPLYHATFVPTMLNTTPSVFTMHDVSPFTHPEFYPSKIRQRLTTMICNGLKNARLIICISQNCLDTTAEYFKISRDKMRVVHHGVNPLLTAIDKQTARQTVRKKYQLNEPFILYLGKLEARKNIRRIIEAYYEYKQNTYQPLKLVLAGRRFWDLHGIDETIKHLQLQHDVIELGYIPYQDLSLLYSAAEVFFFPTLWEGFGFPVLEAMQCGTPVITSNVSCLPEIAGDAAQLVDPLEVFNMAQALHNVTSNKQLCQSMIKKGSARAIKFTWEKTAKGTLLAYQQAISI